MTDKEVQNSEELPTSDLEVAEQMRKEAELEKNRKKEAEEQARAEMMAEVKAQIMAELQTEQEQKVALAAEERKRNAAERAEYVKNMKASKEPWVDVEGIISDGHGVGIELDWNDAFIDHLRAEGLTGTDEDQIIQKYVTLLLRDMADQIDEENNTGKSDYEG